MDGDGGRRTRIEWETKEALRFLRGPYTIREIQEQVSRQVDRDDFEEQDWHQMLTYEEWEASR